MNFTIREATLEDYDALCEVYAEIDNFHARLLPDYLLPAANPPCAQEYMAATLANEDAALYVAESEGKVVGLLQLDVEQSPDYPMLIPRRYVHVMELVVLPMARRSGVGRALMAAAERWTQSKGLDELELTVFSFNQGATSLYQELDYAPCISGCVRS